MKSNDDDNDNDDKKERKKKQSKFLMCVVEMFSHRKMFWQFQKDNFFNEK